MFFSKKTLSPFKELNHKLEEVNAALYQHLNNKDFIPTEDDLKLITHMCNLYSTHSAFSSYFQIRMNNRAKGEPETQGKYSDKDKAGYYNIN